MFDRFFSLPCEPQKSYFIFGPRGTGKTSWIKNHLSDAVIVNLLVESVFTQLSARPSAIRQWIPQGYRGWVVIDEIQKVPILLNEVHDLIESQRISFILTGSSARSLRKRGVNLLAGRALVYHMHPLLPQELGKHFNLECALQNGMLPGVYRTDDPKEFLSSYIYTYLKEEVIQEGLTRNLSYFNRFLESASFSQGSLLNYTQVARDCSLNRKVVENYFSILEDLLISHRLYPFARRAKRRLVSHPKFYFFDVGVYRSLRPLGPLDAPEEIGGIALETLFLQTLVALNDYNRCGYEISFWRTANGLEVDFVLYGERGLLAFEIKRASSIGAKDFRGLKEFKKDYPMAKTYLIYGGHNRLYFEDIEVWPFEQALLQLPDLMMNA